MISGEIDFMTRVEMCGCGWWFGYGYVKHINLLYFHIIWFNYIAIIVRVIVIMWFHGVVGMMVVLYIKL